MSTQVAVSADFLAALARLPKAQQKKVREFTEKFQRDPTSPGIHLEKIEDSRDDKVRSARIDQTYRAIVVRPPVGDVYLLVWVDHHDDAYAWARNRVFEVNPLSGALQLYDVQAVDAAAVRVEAAQAAQATAAEPAPERALFEDVDDEDLLFAGVPRPLLPAVRSLRDDAELELLAPHLPDDAAEMLFHLAAGYTLVEAMEELGRSKPVGEVDPQDFGVALARPESRTKFRVPEDEQELAAMLDAPLERWRTFLHPSQRRLVEMKANGPVRVLGGAGTGKTVVLMHRARHLAKNVFTGEHDRILVTTFTRNLALDLRANLRRLCGPEIERIEVAPIYSWAAAFLKRQGHEVNVVPNPKRQPLMDQAIEQAGGDLPPWFYMDEWERVVLGQEIADRDEYLLARRTGRGIRLTRRQRVAVWEVFARYRELLKVRGLVEWDDVAREARNLLERGVAGAGISSVLADEAQDLTPSALRLLRAIPPQDRDSLFLVGDGHQRIYRQPVSLTSCGIEVRGRSRRLKLNYRTTAQIRLYAVGVLEGQQIDDLDGGVDTLQGYRSLRHGPVPQVDHYDKESREADRIVQAVKSWLESTPAHEICLAARTHQLIKNRYKPILEKQGIATCLVETDPESEAAQPGVRLATMHRLKGLEFPKVLIAGINRETMPLRIPAADQDAASAAEHELQERCLFYVATTRARDELVVTGFGERSPFV